MKPKIKKILVLVLLILVLIGTASTLIESNLVYAEETTTTQTATPAGGTTNPTTTTTTNPPSTTAKEQEQELFEQKEDGWGVGDILDGVVGLLLYPLKLLILAIATVMRVLIGTITAIGGEAVWSVEDILFNRTELTSINFFESTSNSTISLIRGNVATWYIVMRNISIVVLLFILLYVGIRMALATVGEQEAKYKKMLKDWIVSIALVFVLHYIMIFTININNILVEILDDGRDYMNSIGTFTEINAFDDALTVFAESSFSIGFSSGFGSAIIYIMLIGVTLMFLIMYIKRMLTVGFLIIIAPLITITYSIDKMGDGKSQALNAWLKEFVFNILIQPFHCIIYIVFADTAMKLVINDNTLASAVLAIIMIVFIFAAEKIIKKIFNFQASSLGDAIGSSAAMLTGISLVQKAGKAGSNKADPDKIPDMKNSGKSRGSVQSGKGKDMPQSGKGKDMPQSGKGKDVPQSGKGEGVPQSGKAGGNNKKSTAKKVGSTVGHIAGQVLNPVSEFNRKAASMIFLGGLGLSTGSAKAGMSGLYAGSAAADGITGMLNKRTANKMVKENQESFAGSYQDYQAKANLTDRQMERKTAQMLDMSQKDALAQLDEDGYEYWTQVQAMKQTFNAVGEDSADDAVLATIQMIQNGEIHPYYDEEREWRVPSEPTPEPEPAPEPPPTPKPEPVPTPKPETKKRPKKKKS